MECFMCKGELEEKRVDYMEDSDNTIIVIKDVPARVCKKCGEKFYDDSTAKIIEQKVKEYKEKIANML